MLIVDDDPDVGLGLKLGLEKAGYSVRLAANGAEALAEQRRDCADLVITDVYMPECDGMETIDRFRREFPATKIVAMSGALRQGPLDILYTAKLIGADATLRKPFEVEALLRVLRSV